MYVRMYACVSIKNSCVLEPETTERRLHTAHWRHSAAGHKQQHLPRVLGLSSRIDSEDGWANRKLGLRNCVG